MTFSLPDVELSEELIRKTLDEIKAAFHVADHLADRDCAGGACQAYAATVAAYAIQVASGDQCGHELH